MTNVDQPFFLASKHKTNNPHDHKQHLILGWQSNRWLLASFTLTIVTRKKLVKKSVEAVRKVIRSNVSSSDAAQMRKKKSNERFQHWME